ncbi:hypothetical protein ABK040_009772 [Willaertia magna]
MPSDKRKRKNKNNKNNNNTITKEKKVKFSEENKYLQQTNSNNNTIGNSSSSNNNSNYLLVNPFSTTTYCTQKPQPIKSFELFIKRIKEKTRTLKQLKKNKSISNFKNRTDYQSEESSSEEEDQMSDSSNNSGEQIVQGSPSSLENIIQSYGYGISRGQGIEQERIETILEGLKDDSNDIRQLDAVSELCNLVSVSNESTLSRMQVDKFVPPLLDLLQRMENYDLMVFSARTLNFLMDIFPASCSYVVSGGGINVLASKILVIEYIDLAEIALQCIEHLSHQYAQALLQEGVLMASLTYIDFFSMSMQKKILKIASNLCKAVKNSNYDMICDVLPSISRFLSSSETPMIENAIVCLTRIVNPFVHDEDKLEQICNNSSLIEQSVELLSNDKLPKSTISHVLRLLKTIAYSKKTAINLHEKGIVMLLSGLISQDRSYHDYLPDILSLLQALLPRIPRTHELVCQMSHANRKKLLARMTGVKPPNSDSIPEPPQNSNEGGKLASVFEEQPYLLQNMSEVILEPLITLFSSNHNEHIAGTILQIIGTILHYSSPEVLTESLRNIPFSTFLASLLASDDLLKVGTALQMVETLSIKLSEIFDSYFLREGVINQIKKIGGREPHDQKEELMLEKMKKKIKEAYQKAEKERKEKEEKMKKDAIEKNKRIQEKKEKVNVKEENSSSSSEEETIVDPETISVAWTEPYVEPPKVPKASKYSGKQKSNLKNFELVSFVVTKAQLLLDEYTDRTKESKMESPNALKLKDIGQKLVDFVENPSIVEEEDIIKDLREVIFEGVSNYELLNSNIIHSILVYLSKINGKTTSSIRMQRIFLFCKLFDSEYKGKISISPYRRRRSSVSELATFISTNDIDPTKVTYLAEFVRKLQDVLTSVENFNLNVSETNSLITGISTVLNKLMKGFTLSLTNKDTNQTVQITVYPLNTVKEVCSMIEESLAKQNNENNEETVETTTRNDTSYFHVDESEEDDYVGPNNTVEIETPQQERNYEFLNNAEVDEEEKTEDEKTEFELLYNGKKLLGDMYIFEAFFKFSNHQHPSSLNLWDSTQNMNFVKKESTNDMDTSEDNISTESLLNKTKEEIVLERILDFNFLLLFKKEEGIDNDAIEILELLRIMHGLSKNAPILPHTEGVLKPLLPPREFINPRLASKLVRFIQDPYYLFGHCLPDWISVLMEHCHFLFTTEIRTLYFDLTTKGIARAIQTIQSRQTKTNDLINHHQRRGRLIHINKQKIKLAREPNLLESAYKALIHENPTKRVLEFEFKDEIGTGQGPTMEFFTIVSKELQLVGLDIFKDDFVGEVDIKSDNERLVETKTGLYPKLKKYNDGKIDTKDFNVFYFMGKFIGRAVLDGRILDLPFSDALLKLMRGDELTYYDIENIDPTLFQQLERLNKMIKRYKEIKTTVDDIEEQKKLIDEMTLDNDGKTKLEYLCMTFTVIGTDIELVDGGKDKDVTIENLEEYLNLLIRFITKDGVIQQVNALRSGFNSIFQNGGIQKLRIFTIKELSDLLVGCDEEWTEELLLDATKSDHGYTHSSRAVKLLFKVMLTMTPTEKRDFLRFVTGAPRLPAGGIRSLRPKLTIVLKKPESGKSPDQYLPSVMTCTNYLKLPEYSNEQVLREQLFKAISEGQNAFLLS